MARQQVFSGEVKGLKELIRNFDKAPKEVERAATRAMDVTLKLGQEIAGTYPPSSEANQPPPPYYKRGTGMVYKSVTRRTSQQLGKSWTVQILENGFKGILGTKVTYAVWVHVKELQAWFHKLRGWQALEDIFNKTMDKAEVYWQRASDQIAEFLTRQ